MKQSIAWHEQCLKNSEQSYERELKELERMQARVERSKEALEFYQAQVETAKLKGMDGFDCERFMKTRK